MITTVTGKNQVTIPAKLADAVGIHAGTRIEWAVGGDGILIAQVLPSRGELARKAEGMGKAWLKEGEDPIAELIAERAKDDYDEGLE
jgi:AbrB family looped-hinge helix DNA binding protein